jgi:enoyl-CoA hydratase/carnithine racemase
VLDGVTARAGLRGVVLTGTDAAFAAGADLEEVSALTALEAVRFSALGQGLMRKIECSRLPVVAAIRGYCLGGGFDLAMACHLRVAATDAVFGHPGGSLGLVTGWGGTARLPRLVGHARALELLTTGQTIPADEAYAARLVNRLTSPDQTIAAAKELLRRPPAT